MNEGFSNVYEDRSRAEAYAGLEFPGTYYLAFRDLPAIINEHVGGDRAMDFGCGGGRSTRFLQGLGFETVGVDIAETMLEQARARDPRGDYRHLPDGDLDGFDGNTYHLILSAFTFDNIPGRERKIDLFRSLKRLLTEGGCIVNLVSSPEIYLNEWASFTTKEFPENRSAKSGDPVRIVMLDVDDGRPVVDILCTDDDYRKIYRNAGLVPIGKYKPLAMGDEPIHWVNETKIPPWIIYVLGHETL